MEKCWWPRSRMCHVLEEVIKTIKKSQQRASQIARTYLNVKIHICFLLSSKYDDQIENFGLDWLIKINLKVKMIKKWWLYTFIYYRMSCTIPLLQQTVNNSSKTLCPHCQYDFSFCYKCTHKYSLSSVYLEQWGCTILDITTLKQPAKDFILYVYSILSRLKFLPLHYFLNNAFSFSHIEIQSFRFITRISWGIIATLHKGEQSSQIFPCMFCFHQSTQSRKTQLCAHTQTLSRGN